MAWSFWVSKNEKWYFQLSCKTACPLGVTVALYLVTQINNCRSFVFVESVLYRSSPCLFFSLATNFANIFFLFIFRYSYLSPLQIKQIPVPKLAAPSCLVVTWVTNRQKHLRFVKEELYPSWSVEVVAEWHWVKVSSKVNVSVHFICS